MTIKHSVGDKVVLDTTHAYNNVAGNQTSLAERLTGTLTVERATPMYVDVRTASGDLFQTLYHARFLPAPAVLKVGDKVRITKAAEKDGLRHCEDMFGKTYTVTECYSRSMISLAERGQGSWTPSFFELVPATAPEAPAAAPEAPTKGTFIIVVKNPSGTFAPSTTPREYSSAKQAKVVALKMAEKNPGEEFFIFQAVAKASVAKPVVPAAVFTDL